MSDSTKEVLATFFGDESFPVEWKDEEEKKLFWFFDDNHVAMPISPMYFSLHGWWGPTLDYMCRRFGFPIGQAWNGKRINGYLYSAITPRDPKEAGLIGPYYGWIMNTYAENFLEWWQKRYIPEILRNFEYIDSFPVETASLQELMVYLEEAIDIQERHFRLHWILNLAQFQSSMDFQGVANEVVPGIDGAILGRILISIDDRNWEAIENLWKLKEEAKANKELKAIFDSGDTSSVILPALQASEARYRSLFDSIPYEAFSLTVDGTVQEANRLFTGNWGDAVGRLLLLVVEDAGVSGLYKNLIKKVLESKEPQHDIFSIIRQEEKVYYSTMISPILTSEGELIGMVGMNINTTAQMINLARLRRLSMRLVEVQEDERTHIAREIHDSMGQYLTALQMEIGALSNECHEADDRVISLLNSAKSTINEAIRVGRSLVQTLRTPVLDDFGLEAASKDYVEEFKNKWNIRIVFKSYNAANLLSREVETTLFRVLQEACLNVLKYAQTDLIEIRLKRMKNRVTLSVRDYGVGFEPGRPGLRETGHFGLLAMQERIELMDGRFRLLSKPDSGTLIVALIPLRDKEPA